MIRTFNHRSCTGKRQPPSGYRLPIADFQLSARLLAAPAAAGFTPGLAAGFAPAIVPCLRLEIVKSL